MFLSRWNVYSRSRRCVSGLDQWTTNTICFYEATCLTSQPLCNMVRNFILFAGVLSVIFRFINHWVGKRSVIVAGGGYKEKKCTTELRSPHSQSVPAPMASVGTSWAPPSANWFTSRCWLADATTVHLIFTPSLITMTKFLETSNKIRSVFTAVSKICFPTCTT
jgi:hypothetical protein